MIWKRRRGTRISNTINDIALITRPIFACAYHRQLDMREVGIIIYKVWQRAHCEIKGSARLRYHQHGLSLVYAAHDPYLAWPQKSQSGIPFSYTFTYIQRLLDLFEQVRLSLPIEASLQL